MPFFGTPCTCIFFSKFLDSTVNCYIILYILTNCLPFNFKTLSNACDLVQ